VKPLENIGKTSVFFAPITRYRDTTCLRAMVYFFLSASAGFAGAASGPRHLRVSAPEESRYAELALEG
jgi:hypothetical protein